MRDYLKKRKRTKKKGKKVSNYIAKLDSPVIDSQHEALLFFITRL